MTCLQTISFNRLGKDMGFRLKVDLDPTARYLVLADINKCLSVEQVGAFYDGFDKDCPLHFKEETLGSLEQGAD